jgi:hypothetical protein
MTDFGDSYLKFLAELYEIVHAAGRKQKDVKVVAVSKTHPVSALEQVYAKGCCEFGENRVPEFLEKTAFPFRGHGEVHWHFIGPLQKNKVSKILGKTTLIHSVDTLDLAKKISEGSAASGIVTSILAQVNTSGESSKQGFTPQEFNQAVSQLKELPGIKLEGLMTMAPLTDNEAVIRRAFAALRKLRDDAGLVHLSMGMSNDYKIAVEEGSTILRVGTKIFS